MFKYEIGQEVDINRCKGSIVVRKELIDNAPQYEVETVINGCKVILGNVPEKDITLIDNKQECCFKPDFKFEIGDLIISPANYCYEIVNRDIDIKRVGGNLVCYNIYDIKGIGDYIREIKTKVTEEDLKYMRKRTTVEQDNKPKIIPFEKFKEKCPNRNKIRYTCLDRFDCCEVCCPHYHFYKIAKENE